MAMAAEAVALAEELGLRDRVVFFNFGWVPYAERGRYLLEADVAVSAHFDDIETRFAFRTRFLDCLWAGLPVVTTRRRHARRADRRQRWRHRRRRRRRGRMGRGAGDLARRRAHAGAGEARGSRNATLIRVAARGRAAPPACRAGHDHRTASRTRPRRRDRILLAAPAHRSRPLWARADRRDGYSLERPAPLGADSGGAPALGYPRPPWRRRLPRGCNRARAQCD